MDTKERIEEKIMEALTDEVIELWHTGEADGHPLLEELFEKYGAFEVWGSRTGPEPLTVNLNEPRPGRPPIHDAPMTVYSINLADAQADWAAAQPGGRAATIRALIDQEMAE